MRSTTTSEPLQIPIDNGKLDRSRPVALHPYVSTSEWKQLRRDLKAAFDPGVKFNSVVTFFQTTHVHVVLTLMWIALLVFFGVSTGMVFFLLSAVLLITSNCLAFAYRNCYLESKVERNVDSIIQQINTSTHKALSWKLKSAHDDDVRLDHHGGGRGDGSLSYGGGDHDDLDQPHRTASKASLVPVDYMLQVRIHTSSTTTTPKKEEEAERRTTHYTRMSDQPSNNNNNNNTTATTATTPKLPSKQATSTRSNHSKLFWSNTTTPKTKNTTTTSTPKADPSGAKYNGKRGRRRQPSPQQQQEEEEDDFELV